jgi:general secretion pathway protein L
MAKTAKPSSSLMPDLSRVSLRFLAWWSGELAALVPERLRLWWRESDRIVMLSFNGRRVVFERPTGVRRETIHAFEPGAEDPSAHRGELVRRLQQAVGRNFRLLLCLPPDQVLRRTLTLPLAVEENLRQALTFELDRYTPFRPEQVYFDFRVIERDAGQKRLSVDLAVVPRTTVDQGMARAAALGVTPNGAVLADDVVRQGGECRNLLPAGAEGRKSPARPWWRMWMAALMALLLLALLTVPIWQKRNTVTSLLDPLNKAKAAAQETDALRDRLRILVEEHNLLHDKKWDSHSTLATLAELSKLLPDDTFVVQFIFDGKTMQIQGDTASSTSLVETLDASPMFKDVGFKSPLTKIPGTPNDRFHLSATLEAGAKPKPPATASGVTGGSAAAASPAEAATPAVPTAVDPAPTPASANPAGKS